MKPSYITVRRVGKKWSAYVSANVLDRDKRIFLCSAPTRKEAIDEALRLLGGGEL